jgi:hypothetical protein
MLVTFSQTSLSREYQNKLESAREKTLLECPTRVSQNISTSGSEREQKLTKADDRRIVLERSIGWKLLNATT